MNKSQILALYDQDQRMDVQYPGMRREVVTNLVRHVDTSNKGEGIITYSRLSEANVDDTIHAQVDYYENIRQDFEWKVYDYDKPSDLKERLGAYGFGVEEAEALVVLDLGGAPRILHQPVQHNIQRIVDPVKLADVQSVEQQVWNEDSSWVFDFLGRAIRNTPEQMSVYVAYIDERPVSAAWIYFGENSQFASLWGGATIRNFRNRGLYSALLTVRAQEAKARQVSYLTVDASPMSKPILEKFGFELLAYTYPCKWKRQPN